MEPEINLCKYKFNIEIMHCILTLMLIFMVHVLIHRVIEQVFPCFIRAPSDSNTKPVDQLYTGNAESLWLFSMNTDASCSSYISSIPLCQMRVIRAFCWTWRGLTTAVKTFRSGGLWTSRRQGRSTWDPSQSWRRRERQDCSCTSSVIKSVLPAWASSQVTGESRDTVPNISEHAVKSSPISLFPFWFFVKWQILWLYHIDHIMQC